MYFCSMLFIKIFFLGTIIVLASCKTQQVKTVISADQLTNNIEQKLGNNHSQTNNYDNTYVLGLREDASSGTLVIRYGVWEIKTGNLIYAGTALRGSVQWLDNSSLLVEDIPGTVDDGKQRYKFKIDLNTKIKTPLNDEEH